MRTTQTRTPTPKTRADSAALRRCIEPVAAEDFLGGYWEQRPLVVPRREPDRFHDLLSPRDVERLICSSGLRYPAFRLVREGSVLDPGSYTVDIPWRPAAFTGTIDVERVLVEFGAGATIVLQGLHHNWHPLAVFCRELEAGLGHTVQVNAYFTPRSAQGLAVHHDTHDVFVLQVSGSKHWRIYEPALELPLSDQRYSKDLGEPGETVVDVTLGAGDSLYMPRGWLHEALTSDDDSLHLTVGVKLYTWLDAFRAAVDECADEVEFRRSVPQDGEMEADLVASLQERLSPERVVARMRERFVRGRRPILNGQLSQLEALERLTLETAVERRPTVIAELDGSTLLFEGKAVTFPGRVQPELELIAAAEGPLRASELPGTLDDEGRLVLVRRLVREGFLRIQPSAM